MSLKAVGDVIEQWINDPQFRAELRKDPEGTIRKSGCTLSEEEWKIFRMIDWKQSDEALKARISKGL